MYTETIKDISIRYNYTRNDRRLQMSMNDKDSWRKRDEYQCQIDKYHNMTKLNTQNLQFNKVC